MHIGITVWSLLENKGGIERKGCNLARALLDRGHSVTLFCKKMSGRTPVFPVPEGAALTALSLNYDTASVKDAATAIAACDLDVMAVLFSWESLLWFPALLKGSGVPLLISEHSAPEYINSKWNMHERYCCLDTADAIHVLLGRFISDYPERFHDRLRVIPNPAFLMPVPAISRSASGRRTIISAGRFVEDAKQFSLLIKAFALLKERWPEWDLEICGDGKDLPYYKKLAAKLALNERLRLPGMLHDLSFHYASADIFCIPSKYEGFGMVTVEAQAAGLPAVGFANCPGVNEIIVHDDNGLLADAMTAEALADHLEILMQDEELRHRMGERGKSMLDRFAPHKVYDAWESLLFETAGRKNNTRIMELESMTGPLDAQTIATRELLARPHPYDRSRYLAEHERLKKEGSPSPFSNREVASFLKKQKKFGFPGYRAPFTEIRRMGRKLLRAFL